MYFTNRKHFERFKELVMTFSFRNSEKEKEFNACLYIFSKSEKLFDISKKYVSRNDIDFTTDIDFTNFMTESLSEKEKVFINLAQNLFSNEHKINILEIVSLGSGDYKIFLESINICKNNFTNKSK